MAGEKPPAPDARASLRALEALLALPATSLPEALTEASDLLSRALRADKFDVFLLEARSDTLVAVGTSDTPMGRKQHAIGMHRLQLANGGRAVEVFRTGAPHRDGRVEQDPVELRGVKEGLGVRSSLLVALDVEGTRRGVLGAVSASPDYFTSEDLHFLQAIAGWVAALTHRAEMVEALTRAAAEAARRATGEELLRVLAHDLRDALLPLRLRIQMLAASAKKGRRAADVENARVAEQAVDHIQHVIRDLLDAGRLEQGMFTLAPQLVDLRELAARSASIVSLPQTPVEVRGEESLLVLADPDRVRQALENLLSNAVRHSPPGAPVVLTLAVEPPDGLDPKQAVLEVADQGPGIAPELLPHVFTKFVRGGTGGGLGLGLFLAHGIAAAHGGSLSVESVAGRGTRFRLVLPVEARGVGPLRAGDAPAP